MNKKPIITALLFITAVTANAQLLFRISGNGLNAPSYVVGTYHIVDESFVDSIPGLRQAFADCQQVYTEVLKTDVTSADSLALKKAQLLPKGMTIDKLLSSEEMNRLNAYVKRIIGADLSNSRLASLCHLTPTALSLTLSILIFAKKYGRLMKSGTMIDDYFPKEAMKQGKSAGGLETMAFQLDLIYGYTVEEQKEALMCMVDNGEIMEKMEEDIAQAYLSRDLNRLYELLDRKMAICCLPEERAAMLDNRNADWLTKMPAIMREKPTLFAVGAGHLLGENGVLNLLRKAGYMVESVQ